MYKYFQLAERWSRGAIHHGGSFVVPSTTSNTGTDSIVSRIFGTTDPVELHYQTPCSI